MSCSTNKRDVCPSCNGSKHEIKFTGHSGAPTATPCSTCEGTGKLPETKKNN